MSLVIRKCSIMTRDVCVTTSIAINPPKVLGPDAKMKTTDGGTCSCTADRCNSHSWDAVFHAAISGTIPRSIVNTSSIIMSTTESRPISTTQNAPRAPTESVPISISRSFGRSFSRPTTVTEANAAPCVISYQSYILITIVASIIVNVFGDRVYRPLHTIFFHLSVTSDKYNFKLH